MVVYIMKYYYHKIIVDIPFEEIEWAVKQGGMRSGGGTVGTLLLVGNMQKPASQGLLHISIPDNNSQI